MSGLLDNTIKKATAVNARELVIFSYPKVGKTKLLTKLPGSYLILDFEGGTDFFDCSAINIDSLETFHKLREEFIQKNPFYDFIALDTITMLYAKIANAIAVQMYNLEEKKSKPLDWDITTLQYGLGYTYKRNAMQKVLDFFRQYCHCLILCGHVADKAMGDANEKSSVKDIDLEGKLKNIVALKTDALGLLYRSSPTTNHLSFTATTGQIGGTRIPHLSNEDILISTETKKENGEIVFETFWDKVFIKP